MRYYLGWRANLTGRFLQNEFMSSVLAKVAYDSHSANCLACDECLTETRYGELSKNYNNPLQLIVLSILNSHTSVSRYFFVFLDVNLEHSGN